MLIYDMNRDETLTSSKETLLQQYGRHLAFLRVHLLYITVVDQLSESWIQLPDSTPNF